MKIKRSISYLIIALVYALASGVGIAVFYASRCLGVWLALLIADVSATIVTFVFSVIFKNASVYDPYWSVQPLVILITFAIAYKLSLASALLLAVVAIWSLRLSANWAYTFHGMEHQDWRYTMLKEKSGALYPLVNLVGIHLVPTVIVYLCTMPAVLLIMARPSLTLVALAPLALSLLGIGLELVADIQMHLYKKTRPTPFIRIGLWEHSRHPNYLGEILMWWGVALYCIAHLPSLWYLFVGALANSALFVLVSIPLAEDRQSKKEGWDEYYKATTVLIPLKKAQKPTHKRISSAELESEAEVVTAPEEGAYDKTEK